MCYLLLTYSDLVIYPLIADEKHIYRRADVKDLEQVNNPGMLDSEVRFIFQIIRMVSFTAKSSILQCEILANSSRFKRFFIFRLLPVFAA